MAFFDIFFNKSILYEGLFVNKTGKNLVIILVLDDQSCYFSNLIVPSAIKVLSPSKLKPLVKLLVFLTTKVKPPNVLYNLISQTFYVLDV